MQNIRTYLLLAFGLGTPLVQAMNSTNSTTNFNQQTKISGNPTATQPLSDGDLMPTDVRDLPIPTPLVNRPSTDVTAALVNTTSVNSTAIQALSDSDLIPTAATDLPLSTTSVETTSAEPTTTQPLTNGDLNRTATMDTLPTTLVTMTSASPSDTQSTSEAETTFNPIPTSSPSLSITFNYTVPTPTPGSIAILNGIPIRVLSNTIQQASPVLADMATNSNDDTEGSTDPVNLYQPWNTSYPGPIHDGDWNKYLQIWDPVWWSLNLDSLRQTACMCSADDWLTNPDAQLAAFMNFEFYSHQTGAVYAMDWSCGPSHSSMTIPQRITSVKIKSEHCWTAAGGEFAGDDYGFDIIKGWYCDEKEELCVEPWRDGKRALKFRGHKRNYDRAGTHTWSEVQTVVRDVCKPKCRDMFGMQYNDFSPHNPNFVTVYYPPKPIDLNIVDG